jgi:group I intron endonuclease
MYCITDDKCDVKGEIYLMTNNINGMKYIGQTLTHRKNKGRYRPFGYIGRFNDHVSEAVCNTKKKQCRYLNNAIRKYGKEQFSITLVETCEVRDLDTREQFYIEHYDSQYPNGYNLTRGGKTTYEKNTKIEEVPSSHVIRAHSSRSDHTKQRISKAIKERFNEDIRATYMLQAQQQHYHKKVERFRGVEFDGDVDKYIYTINSAKHGVCVRVKAEGKRAEFVGKYLNVDELRELALNFIKTIKEMNRQHAQIAGNP